MANGYNIVITQENSDFKITSPLEEGTLILKQLSGQERISEPFVFDVTMQSLQNNIDPSALLGKPLTVTLNFGSEKRYVNGIIGQFSQGRTETSEGVELTYYKAKIYPKLWLLTLTRDCRIFQNMTTLEIIHKVLEDQGVSEVEDFTQGAGKKKREFCVQYNESSFNFISRLMEQEGIFYFFAHNEDSHSLILADDASAYHACPFVDGVPIHKSQVDKPYLKVINHCGFIANVVPQTYALTDYNYTTASVDLFSTATGQGGGGQIYEYPGNYALKDEGDTYTNLRLTAEEFPRSLLEGASTVPFFAPGCRFDLTGHDREDANKNYILLEVFHTLFVDFEENDGGSVYKNAFKAFSAEQAFKPVCKTPKLFISTTQTAKVTGKEGEEIWADEYGRIKIKFPWDRLGQEDETSSCWVRVAQGWAGNQWGALFIPRVGQEVVVTFINGDPDRPLVTGCVYNSDNMPPYLPQEPTKSALKSNSSKGGAGFNEIRFDDLAEEEEIYVHAQKDLNVEVIHNRTVTLEEGDDTLTLKKGSRLTELQGDGGNYTITLAKGDRSLTIDEGNEDITLKKGDQTIHLTAGNQEIALKKGNQTITLNKGNRSLTLKKGGETILLKDGSRSTTLKKGDETHTNGGNFTHNTKKNHVLVIKGNLTIRVKGDILIEGKKDLTVNASRHMAFKAGGNITLKAGGNLAAQSGMEMTLKSGTNATLQGGTGVNVKSGAMMGIKASASLNLSAGATLKAGGSAGVSVETPAVLTLKGSLTKIN